MHRWTFLCLAGALMACAQPGELAIPDIGTGGLPSVPGAEADTLAGGTEATHDPAPDLNRADLESDLSDDVEAGEQVGGFELRLIDAPIEAEAIWVTFCEVAVHFEGGDARRLSTQLPNTVGILIRT